MHRPAYVMFGVPRNLYGIEGFICSSKGCCFVQVPLVMPSVLGGLVPEVLHWAFCACLVREVAYKADEFCRKVTLGMQGEEQLSKFPSSIQLLLLCSVCPYQLFTGLGLRLCCRLALGKRILRVAKPFLAWPWGFPSVPLGHWVGAASPWA